MAGGNVQRVKIVIFGFGLGARHHREVQAREYATDLLLYERERVEMAASRRPARRGKVQARIGGSGCSLLNPCNEKFLDFFLKRLGLWTQLAPLFHGDIFERT